MAMMDMKCVPKVISNMQITGSLCEDIRIIWTKSIFKFITGLCEQTKAVSMHCFTSATLLYYCCRIVKLN